MTLAPTSPTTPKEGPDGPARPGAATAWVLTGGARGMENQCLGLAEAAGFAPEVKRIAVRAPWRWLPEALWPLWGDPAKRLAPGSDPVGPPWPDLLVCCGRLSVPFAIHIRKASGGRTFTVQCQDPRIAPDNFGLVVPPEHDRMKPAPNVFPLLGSPNRVTPARLAEGAEAWRGRFAALPRPLVAVLIGGSSSAYRMTPESVRALFDRLDAWRAAGAGFAITTSRRTDAAVLPLIRERAAALGAWLWDASDSEGSDNPYFGLLGLADAVVVTADSVNMAAEAAVSGRPVYVAPLAGGSEKFRHFHASLAARGITRALDGPLAHWTYEPLNETGRAAAEIRRIMAARGQVLPPPGPPPA